MKLKVLTVISILTAGCASTIGYNFNVSSEEKVAKGITYNFDNYTQKGQLKTESYLSEGGEPGKAITYFYRAYFKNNTITHIQLYTQLRSAGWCFLDKVYNEFGQTKDITLIDREVISGEYVWEDLALNLSRYDIKKFSQQDMNFKAVGKRCSIEFKIDKRVSSAFNKSLEKGANETG